MPHKAPGPCQFLALSSPGRSPLDPEWLHLPINPALLSSPDNIFTGTPHTDPHIASAIIYLTILLPNLASPILLIHLYIQAHCISSPLLIPPNTRSSSPCLTTIEPYPPALASRPLSQTLWSLPDITTLSASYPHHLHGSVIDSRFLDKAISPPSLS